MSKGKRQNATLLTSQVSHRSELLWLTQFFELMLDVMLMITVMMMWQLRKPPGLTFMRLSMRHKTKSEHSETRKVGSTDDQY